MMKSRVAINCQRKEGMVGCVLGVPHVGVTKTAGESIWLRKGGLLSYHGQAGSPTHLPSTHYGCVVIEEWELSVLIFDSFSM